jgi:hypothetical protein
MRLVRRRGGIAGVVDDQDEIPAAPACIPGAGAGASIAARRSPVAPGEAQERAPKHKTDRDGLQPKDRVKHFSLSLTKPGETLRFIVASAEEINRCRRVSRFTKKSGSEP